tara:strand:+ start:136 stop:900 length:765 start_codon:yes stop_codon:yes gene_type:complete
MIKKRLIGAVVVKDGIAVQSFSYDKYLPLGKPEVIIKNLDRWGVDEILINVIDRSKNNQNPDFDLLKKIQKMNITTSLIYGGGISNLKNANQVINLGADRILIETAVLTKYKDIQDISLFLGSQALVLSLPVILKKKIIKYFNYRNKKIEDLSKNINLSIKDNLFSEIMIIDPIGDGFKDRFDETLIKDLDFNLPLICFGGIHSNLKINKIFKTNPKVNAIAVGNSLNYKEHAVQKIKEKTKNKKFRKSIYISG